MRTTMRYVKHPIAQINSKTHVRIWTADKYGGHRVWRKFRWWSPADHWRNFVDWYCIRRYF